MKPHKPPRCKQDVKDWYKLYVLRKTARIFYGIDEPASFDWDQLVEDLVRDLRRFGSERS